ncbi:MAG: hypothetical protein HKN47_09310 [Pirellulaceae bacterium]|nr:hypothetical protein [Pirellulaceae bacterium]
MLRIAIVLSSLLLTDVVSAQSFPFVIPGDDGVPSVTSRNVLLGGPIDADPFVTVRDGHFHRGDRRIRFWGVNLCFGANFPTHDEADRIAPHLAKLGVNAVRFHHMDMQNAPNGIWAAVDDNGVRHLDAEMVDRLDYFLARLHEQGIFANLNLHVSRTLSPREGFPAEPKNLPWWAASNKWVMYYDRDVQAEVKRYCHDLLTHRNPYRGNKARVDDAGIAIIEMLNENFFSVKGYDLYRTMSPRFQASLIQRWNEWLQDRYTDQPTLQKSWNEGQPKLGDHVFANAAWSDGLGGWYINEPDDGLPSKFAVPGPDDQTAIRLMPKHTTPQNYEQQLLRDNLSVEKNQPLTLSYWVRSDARRSYQVELSTAAGGNWRDLGLFENPPSTPEWTRVKRIIFPTESISHDARLVFSIGDDVTPIEFADVSLRRGAEADPLPDGQSLASKSIGIPEANWPVVAHQDMRQFMVDTELAWVKELKTYLRKLGVKVPITASQVNYHDHRVHAEANDFVDLHNYWHHPMFPSDAPWSASRWTVGNEPMEADPTRSQWPANSLLMRTPWRVRGKPMTLSEWNYPEPGPPSSGCVPMAAILASLQDWDGVFFFDYDAFSRPGGDDSLNESPFFRDEANNFFSFNGQPVKLAALSQFANLFLRGDVKPLTDEIVSTPDAPVDGTLALSHRLSVSAEAETQANQKLPDATNLRSPDGQVIWESTPPTHGTIRLNTPASQGVWGTIAASDFQVGETSIHVGAADPNYGLVLLSSSDGQSLHNAKSIVLLAASRSENQAMKWNAERTSVGTQWGHGPTMVTSFDLTIRLPSKKARRCFALDSQGQRQSEIPTVFDGTTLTIKVGPEHRTLWYELQ